MTALTDDIFSNGMHKPSHSEPPDQVHDHCVINRVEATTFKQLIQSLWLEIAEVKSSCIENIKKAMQTKISVLEKEKKGIKRIVITY